MVLVEVCVDNIESVKNALAGGAGRIELCSALAGGGLTPTPGFLKKVKELCLDYPSTKLMCLIRCRGGNFQYTKEEEEIMSYDIESLMCAGADGFVLGALTEDGRIDVDLCQRLMLTCGEMPVTFHRAFDSSTDAPEDAISAIKTLGCTRLLTSGRAEDVIAGLDNLEEINRLADGKLIVMPGGGVRLDNIKRLRDSIPIEEVHMSASTVVESLPGMGSRRVAQAGIVRSIVEVMEGTTGVHPPVGIVRDCRSRI